MGLLSFAEYASAMKLREGKPLWDIASPKGMEGPNRKLETLSHSDFYQPLLK